MLSALRLCGWRFDNGYMKLFSINYALDFAFGAKKWEVFENGIFPDFVAGFISADRAMDKVCVFHIVSP